MTKYSGPGYGSGVIGCVAALSLGATAFAQSTEPAVFVSHNGNLEGSVASFFLDPEDGTLTFNDFLITGENAPGGFDAGTNAATMDLTPNGRYLAVGHLTGDPPPGQPPGRRISIIRVSEDATLTEVLTFNTPSSPLNVRWLNDQHLAVTESSFGGANFVHVYEFDAIDNTSTLIDSKSTGGFNTSLAVHPDRTHLFAQDSLNNLIFMFEINDDGTLNLLDTQSTSPAFPLGMGVSPNGHWLYAGGGISDGGNKVIGVSIDLDGETMEEIFGSPFESPGSSPKQVVVEENNKFAYAGHGTDSTVRGFTISERTGRLIAIDGVVADFGGQGDLGKITVSGNLLLGTRRFPSGDIPRGVQVFHIGDDGSLDAAGPVVTTQGITPESVRVWRPDVEPCPEDLTGEGVVNGLDLLILLAEWGPCDDPDDCPADFTGDGVVDGIDLLQLLGAWGPCP